MSQRLKVLQLQPDYNVKQHDFADLAEQIVKALPSERYEVTAAFCVVARGLAKPSVGQTVRFISSFPTRRSRECAFERCGSCTSSVAGKNSMLSCAIVSSPST